MRDPRTTIQSCLRLSIDRGATDGERAAARAMAEKLSRIHNIPLETVGPSSSNKWDFEDILRRAAEHARREAAAKESYTKVGNIGDFCFQMLGRDLGGFGYPYAEVLRAVAVRFPGAKTSVASLRWYETRMRKSGLHVPKRKRPSKR